MKEVERKILGIDKTQLIATIESLSKTHNITVKKTFEGLVRINYFDFEDGRIRAKKDLLRVREFVPDVGESYVEIVYKTYGGVQDDCKIFDECEIGLPQNIAKITGKDVCETWKLFLEKLGLKRVVYYEKRRTHYDCGSFKCEIDEHPKIPVFVEIEAQSAAEIDRAVVLLKLGGLEQTPDTISEILARRYPHLTLSDLTF